MRRPLLGPVLLALALRLAARPRHGPRGRRTSSATSAWPATSSTSRGTRTRRSGSTPTPRRGRPSRRRPSGSRGAASGSFAVNVKLPVLAADLLLVALLAAAARAGRASPLAPWLYAAPPRERPRRRRPRAVRRDPARSSSCSPSRPSPAAGATPRRSPSPPRSPRSRSRSSRSPSSPSTRGASWRSAARYAALALAPGALLLLPFAIADAGALRRELLAYGGIADFGWTGVWRGPPSGWRRAPCRAARPASGRRPRLRLEGRSSSRAWAALVARGARAAGCGSPPQRAVSRRCSRSRPSTACRARSTCCGRCRSASCARAARRRCTPRRRRPGSSASTSSSPPASSRPAPLDGDAAARAGRLWLVGAAATLAPRLLLAWLVAVVREGRARRACAPRPTRSDAALDLALALTHHLEGRDEPRTARRARGGARGSSGAPASPAPSCTSRRGAPRPASARGRGRGRAGGGGS